MKKVIANNRAEGHIDIGVKIIIAVVIGALILGGLYMLFAGNNGVFDKLNNKIYDMSNTGEERSLKMENGQMLYSYDNKTWVDITLPGLEENGKVKNYVTLTNNESVIHLVLISNPSNSVIYRSVDGKEWTPVRTSNNTSWYLVESNSGTAATLYYGDGESYKTTDGLSWKLSSTKFY